LFLIAPNIFILNDDSFSVIFQYLNHFAWSRSERLNVEVERHTYFQIQVTYRALIQLPKRN